MLQIKNFLLSGFSFNEEEYELKLQFILLNSFLIIITLILASLAFIRYSNMQYAQTTVDLIAAFASLITIFLARKSKKSIKISIPLLLILFYALISFTFSNIGIIGSIWYLLLILATFFLKGKKVGLFFSILSIITILLFKNVLHNQYTLFEYIYITIPITIGVTFLYLYELRNEILNFLLKQQKDSLQNEVDKQTEELSKLLIKSQELASIVKDSLLEIYIVDFETDQYLYVNDGAISALGYSENELLQMNFYNINSSMTHENVTKFKTTMQKDGNSMHISKHKRKDGSTYGVQSFMHTIHYKNRAAYVIFDIPISNVQQAQLEILKQKERLAFQAYYDPLTKLPNRVLFNDRLSQAIAKAKRKESKFALLFVDLDHFKEINDTYGHEIGDRVLVEVATRLKSCVRASDTVSRLSGDEFLIIVDEFDTKEHIEVVAKLILQKLQKPIELKEKRLFVTCSIGISIYPDHSENNHTLIKYADRAMYKAKNIGKNTFKFYT